MKKNIFKTVRFNIGSGFNPATPERSLLRESASQRRVVEASPAIEYDPEPPPMPEDWYNKLMAAIHRIGPLRKPSLPMDNETTG